MTKSSNASHEKNTESAKRAVKEMAQSTQNAIESAQREVSENMDHFLSPFFSLQRQAIEDMFSSMTNMWGGASMDKVMPKVSVWEDKEAFHLKTKLPQDNPDNMEVAVNDNILTLKWHEDKSKNNGPHQFYASHDAYRTIVIPENADPEKIEAVCKNGSLEIIVAKKETARNEGRSIPIRRSA
jgi:HSP20 family molecular chaperone IbpA